jgi:hypothetical protein
MVLRVISSQGTALAFIFVALGFLGTAMLLWRVIAVIARRGFAGHEFKIGHLNSDG